MKNVQNLLIKTALTMLVLILLIPVFGKGTWTQTIITGLLLLVISYVIGDLWILPKFGNFTAVLADFGLSALLLWAMVKALPHFTLTTAGILSIALILGLGEWLFHAYLQSTEAPQK